MKKLILSMSLLIPALMLTVNHVNASCETGGPANVYCPYCDVTYQVTTSILGPSIVVTCTTGGQFTCETRGGGSQ